MVSHHPPPPHRHCGSGDMVFVVVDGQGSTCPHLDPPFLFISKAILTHAKFQDVDTLYCRCVP